MSAEPLFPTEQAPIHPAFSPHLLNADGLEKAHRLRWSFSVLLCRIEESMPQGRELAIVRTKLEEACMFAVRGVALAPENRAAHQPGKETSLNAIVDSYASELTAIRVALTKAGIPESRDGRALSQAERVALLFPAPVPLPQYASNEDVARRLYQVYAQDADWKDYRGDPLPTFDEMRETTRAHWLRMAEDLAIHGTTSDSNTRRIAETART